MKRYLHSNDPLFDPVMLGYVLHRGAIRARNKTFTSARDQVTGAKISNWKESFRLIRTGARGQLQRGGGGGTFDPLTGLVALSTFQHRYAWGQFIALLSF